MFTFKQVGYLKKIVEVRKANSNTVIAYQTLKINVNIVNLKHM